MYRNAAQEVIGIWFYNSQECHEVANLFSRILNAFSKVPPKPKIPSAQSEFEELEAAPALIEGPLEPQTSNIISTTSHVQEDPLSAFFSAAANAGSTSSVGVAGQTNQSLFMEDKMRPYPVVINDQGMYDHAKAVAESFLGEENVRVCPLVMGAEDFGFYAQRMAGAFFNIGTHNECTMATTQSLHSPYFEIDEDVLPLGAAFHAAVAIEYLKKHVSA